MTTERESFWSEYYEEVAKKGEPWLDYSNERVQAQTFSLVIGALGPLTKRACLDVGCGFGQLARALRAFGAERVTGIDISAELIAQLNKSSPELDFRRGTLGDDAFRATLGSFDAIALVEVLQYLPIPETLNQAFELLRPGGRLVVVVPNGRCPIVSRSVARFGGNYVPPTPEALAVEASRLTHPANWALLGMWFGLQQELYPYVVSEPRPMPPGNAPAGALGEGTPAPPNRLVLILQKQC
jgi:2-polyprenyl-3-methyl-5-hydroxy-6-metoxy-1,4-benzoquinol methylase